MDTAPGRRGEGPRDGRSQAVGPKLVGLWPSWCSCLPRELCTRWSVARHDVTEDMPEDEETHAVVAQIMAQVGEELNKVVGRSSGV